MKQFMEGKIYCSNLSAFRTIYPERGLTEKAEQGNEEAERILKRQGNKSQIDVSEGTVAELDWNYLCDQIGEGVSNVGGVPLEIFDSGFKEHIITNPRLIAKGYDYCNVLCMCRIEYTRPLMCRRIGYDFLLPDMSDFGEYVVVINDQEAFINRIIQTADKQGYRIVAGDVNYHKLKCGDQVVNSLTSATFNTIECFDISDLNKANHVYHVNYDIFDKWEKYKAQNEWRVALDCRCTDMKATTLDIGDISDIARACKSSEIENTLEKMLRKRTIKFREGYIGNISREEFNRSFLEKSNNEAYVSFMIGKASYSKEV